MPSTLDELREDEYRARHCPDHPYVPIYDVIEYHPCELCEEEARDDVPPGSYQAPQLYIAP